MPSGKVRPVEREDVPVGYPPGRWDELAGPLRGLAEPVHDRALAAFAYLRLAVIDVAVRLGAVLWLTHGPDGSTPPPTWADRGGAAQHFREILDRCGDARPTRD